MWGTESLRGGCSFAPLHAPRPKNPAAGQAKMMLIILQPSTRSLLCAAKSEINRLSPYCFFPPAVEGGGSYSLCPFRYQPKRASKSRASSQFCLKNLVLLRHTLRMSVEFCKSIAVGTLLEPAYFDPSSENSVIKFMVMRF